MSLFGTKNAIRLVGDGNIVIQDTNGDITIKSNDPIALQEFLKTTTQEFKVELLEILQQHRGNVFTKAKNIVAADIHAGGEVHIGDIIYNYPQTKLPKELTGKILLLETGKIIMTTNKYDVLAEIAKKANNKDELEEYFKVFYRFENSKEAEIERDIEKQEIDVFIKENQILIKNTTEKTVIDLDINNLIEVNNKLNNLEDEQLDALTQITEWELNKHIFQTLLLGVSQQKKIVKRNVSKIKKIIRDGVKYYHFYYFRISDNNYTKKNDFIPKM